MGKEREKITLGPAEKIPLGQGRCFNVKGKDVAVFRSRSGEFSAIGNKCPHREGPLCEGIIDQTFVICPYHGHKFNLHTGEGSEAGEEVEVFSVMEEGGEILLEV